MISPILRALAFVAIVFATPHAVAAATEAQVAQAIAETKTALSDDPKAAVAKALVARRLAESLTGTARDRNVATTIWLQGVATVRDNHIDEAGKLFNQALALAERSARGSKLNADTLLARGNWNAENANVAGALKDFLVAYKIYSAIGDTDGKAKALICIAGIYLDANDYQSALTRIDDALDAKTDDPMLLISIHQIRGDALRELKRFDQAEVEFRKAIALARKLGSSDLETFILRAMARNELSAGKLADADRTITRAFAMLGKDAEQDGQLWAVAAKAALGHGRNQEARVKIERAFAIAGPAGAGVQYWEAHKTAYAIYQALGDKANMLVQLEAIKKLDDQTYKLAASINTATLAAQFDNANQKLKIANLQADDARRRANTQFWIFVSTTIVSVVVFGMLGFGLVTIRRSRNEVRAANVDLASSNAALGKALAAKTEFLATTSHEIRTPLNGILGMTQVMLADQRLDPAVRDRIGVVHGAGVSMRALVDDILDVAKMETGNLTIERAPVDLPAMLRDVSRMWQDQAAAKGIGFELELADAPTRIESDPARLRQVIFNLLSNALKFTQNGCIRVQVGTAEGEGGEVVTVAIRDTGIGIPADKLELIFESFRQADAGTTRQFGGTGLGLAICRNIARAMEGDVTVASVTDEGSTFTLTLPLVRVANEAPVAAVDSGEALLIVDKNPISRAMLKTLFAPRVGAVAVAGSPTEAAAMIAVGGIARVLIDEATVAMGGDAEDGLLALAGVPVSLLWTNPDAADRIRLSTAGADQIVAKPIAGAALVAAIVSAGVQDPIDSCAA